MAMMRAQHKKKNTNISYLINTCMCGLCVFKMIFPSGGINNFDENYLNCMEMGDVLTVITWN